MSMMKAKTTNYQSYSDPGHGWIKVERSELVRLGILDKITPYSYQRGTAVFLEEDCDAGTFLKAKEERGERFTFTHHVAAHRSSRIRGYDCFRC